MNDEIKKNISQKMNQAIEHCSSELSKIRTGRASTTLLENLKVDYYGVATPLNSLATITLIPGILDNIISFILSLL